MLLEMKVPSPGESISEVEIAEWLVEDGLTEQVWFSIPKSENSDNKEE